MRVHLVGTPAVVQGAVYVVGDTGSLFQLSQIGSGNWTPWMSLGGPAGIALKASPAASRDNINHVTNYDPFVPVAIGNDDRLYRLAPANQWEAVSSPPLSSPPAVFAQFSDDYQCICVTDTNGVMQTFNNGGSSQWTALPAATLFWTTPHMTWDGEADMEIYAVGADGALWRIHNEGGGGGAFLSWISLGSPPGIALASSPTAKINGAGRYEAFAIGSDGALWHLWQVNSEYALDPVWSAWYSHGTPPGVRLLGFPVLDFSEDERLELFSIGSDGALWHIWQTTVGGGWSDWYSHGTPPGVTLANAPGLASDSDGRLELFAVGSDGDLWHIWQTAKSNGWSDWSSHGSPS